MTQGQIKAIAKEYAKDVVFPKDDTTEEELSDVLMNELMDVITSEATHSFGWLNSRYCIVEREKVMELYDCFSQNIQASRKLGLTHAEDIAKGSCATMRDIFGTLMFNQNEE